MSLHPTIAEALAPFTRYLPNDPARPHLDEDDPSVTRVLERWSADSQRLGEWLTDTSYPLDGMQMAIAINAKQGSAEQLAALEAMRIEARGAFEADPENFNAAVAQIKRDSEPDYCGEDV